MEYEVPYCKVYRIPFRPEYLLIDGKTNEPSGPWNDYELVSSAQPTGRDVKAFRFHLSPEAVDLIIKQDPTVDHATGFCSLEIKFDSSDSDVAMIEARRGVVIVKD